MAKVDYDVAMLPVPNSRLSIFIGRLTSGERGSFSYGTSSQDSNAEGARNVSGIAIKTVTRGFSTEADRLLNYLVSPRTMFEVLSQLDRCKRRRGFLMPLNVSTCGASFLRFTWSVF